MFARLMIPVEVMGPPVRPVPVFTEDTDPPTATDDQVAPSQTFRTGGETLVLYQS